MNPDRWKQLEPILDEALDLEPENRSSYLDLACSGDLELRRELESLLRDCEESNDFLEQVGGAALSQIADTSPHDPVALRRIGDTLGSYRIESILGQGGMGTVYLAERIDGLFDQKVAIKVASGQNLNQEAIERFRFERQVLARLEHPNIARLLDGGVTDDEVPYLVMEWVDGVPLDQHCKTLPVVDRLRLVAEICQAVTYAHRRKVVHRDLKPSNVLVTDEGRVKLLDFGIAELLGRSEEDLTARSGRGSNSSRLTLGYAAPELLTGKDATSSSDLYSLGALLFRLLTNQLPFEPGELPLMEWMEQVVKAPPPAPSKCAKETLPRPKEIDAIVRKALSKAPRHRYSSAEALAEDLQRFANKLPVLALPQTFGYLLRSSLRRHPLPWLIGATTAGLLLFATGGWIQSRQKALRRAELAQRFGQEAERIEWFLRHAQALPRHDISRERAIMESRLESLETQMETLGPSALGPGHFALGRGYARLGRQELAAKHLRTAWSAGYRTAEVALALGQALGELFELERGRTLRIRDPELRATRIKQLQERLLQPARSFLRQGGSPELESSSYLFARIAFFDGHWEEALRRTREAQEEAPWQPDSLRLEADIYLRQAVGHAEQGDYDEAEGYFDSALEKLGQALELAPSDPSLYARACRLKVFRMELFRLEIRNTEPDHLAALEACRQVLEVDPSHSGAWQNQALLLMTRLQSLNVSPQQASTILAQAEEAARRARELAPDAAEPHQTLGAAALFRVIRIQQPAGEDPSTSLEQAAQALRRALELDPGLVNARANLGNAMAFSARLLRSRGQDPTTAFDEAIENFRQAIDRMPHRALLHYNLSNLYLDKGDFQDTQGQDSAETYRAAAVAGHRSRELNPNLHLTLNLLAIAELRLAKAELLAGSDPTERVDRALEFAQQALAANPEYYLASLTQISILTKKSYFEAIRQRHPLPPLDQATALAEKLKTQSNLTSEVYYQYLADLYLARANWATDGEELAHWLSTTARLLAEGERTHTNSAALWVRQGRLCLLRNQRSTPPIAEQQCSTFFDEALRLNPLQKEVQLDLAEARFWVAHGETDDERQQWVTQGRAALDKTPDTQRWAWRKEALGACLDLLSPERDAATRQDLAEILAKDTLLAKQLEVCSSL